MKTKWGQNFLVDQNAAQAIVEALAPEAEDLVLEIGPGRGVLTQHLIKRGCSLDLVEIDEKLAANLTSKWGHRPSVRVIRQDFLKWPLPSAPSRLLKVIGNLPYSAGNPILQKLMDWPHWSSAVFMLQKEVVDRLAARPGGRDYGVLTLAVQGKAEIEKLFDVPPRSFDPPPAVQSSVIRLTRRPESLIEQDEVFFKVVHAAFSQRRKILVNALAGGLDQPKDAVADWLQKTGLESGLRAESLSLDDYNRLVENYPF